jgi:hypothetical protein
LTLPDTDNGDNHALQELKISDAFGLRELPLAILPLCCACKGIARCAALHLDNARFAVGGF